MWYNEVILAKGAFIGIILFIGFCLIPFGDGKIYMTDDDDFLDDFGDDVL